MNYIILCVLLLSNVYTHCTLSLIYIATEVMVCALSTGKQSASTATTTTPTTPGDHQQSSPVTAAEANLCSTVVETPKVSIQLSESDIDREIRELEDEFLKVVKEAAKNLRTVELSEVKFCLTQLRVSVKYRHIRFLERNLSAIANATSVDDILAILGLYWNYYNCGLLAEIVHQLGSDQTKQLMEQYTEKLRRFRLKTKLRDFVGKLTHQTIPNFVELVTKTGEDWQDRTLEDLEQFRKKLAESMHLEDYALYATRTEAGCIAVTWALHSSLPAIADILQSAFQLLEKYGVQKVIFQGKCIPEPKSSEVRCLLWEYDQIKFINSQKGIGTLIHPLHSPHPPD